MCETERGAGHTRSASAVLGREGGPFSAFAQHQTSSVACVLSAPFLCPSVQRGPPARSLLLPRFLDPGTGEVLGSFPPEEGVERPSPFGGAEGNTEVTARDDSPLS